MKLMAGCELEQPRVFDAISRVVLVSGFITVTVSLMVDYNSLMVVSNGSVSFYRS
jgi:hypothetical protein